MPASDQRRGPYRVLVFPGGTEIGLEIAAALGHCKEVVLHSAGSDVSSHAPFAFRRHSTLPSIQEEGWLEALNDVIARHRIDYVFPAYDDVLLALAEHADSLAARVVTSPVETCRTTRSKIATYRALTPEVPVPRVYEAGDADVEFPVFVKPDRGQGSQGAREIRTLEDLDRVARDGTYVTMEHLPGEEHTVDCFSDREAGLLFSQGRRRTRTRAGISMNSFVVDDPVFGEYARRIASRLEFHGAWFFQLRCDRAGTHRLLEVAPRIAGTSGLSRVRGVNLPLLSIFEQERIPVTISVNEARVEIDRALANRYRHDLAYTTVYVDLDDTLIVRGEVNASLVSFLYQCLNRDRRLVLVTRHREDLPATLASHRLHGLWDEVIHVAEGEQKADYVVDREGIFVDDSFSERSAVASRSGVPGFDSSMIEMLMDHRV